MAAALGYGKARLSPQQKEQAAAEAAAAYKAVLLPHGHVQVQQVQQVQQQQAPAARVRIQLTQKDVTLPNKLPNKEARALAMHLGVGRNHAGRMRTRDELCEALRVNWPRSKTDGGAISFPAIILDVSLPISQKYVI